MLMLCENGLRLDADSKRRGISGAQRRVRSFEVLKLAQQAVIVPVRKRRTIEHVILVVRALDLLAERGGPRGQRGIDRVHIRLRGSWSSSPFGFLLEYVHG